MINNKYYELDKEHLMESDFWTNEFYRGVDGLIKYEDKFPIVIPTYNRPDNKFIKYATSHMFNGNTWPIFLVVRKSQEQMYNDSEYVKNFDYVTVLAFEDEEINDIGKVRKKIVEYFSERYKFIFMLDDDIDKIVYTHPYKRESGSNVSLSLIPSYGFKVDMANVFAMWQLSMLYSNSLVKDLILSCAMVQGFSWDENFCDEDASVRFMAGPHTLVTCLNLETFKNKNLNYRTIHGNGHDDIDLLIRALLAGCTTCEYRWLTFFNPGAGTSMLDFDSVKERFTKQYEEMYNNFKNVNFIKWRNRKDIPNVGINWSAAIDYHNSLGGDLWFSGEDISIINESNRKQNIWRNGEIIKEYIDGRIK